MAIYGPHRILDRSTIGPSVTLTKPVALHSPLLPATRNMIAAPEFARMKKKPLVINCGSGGLVNEADLVEALDRGQIAGIGFDCLTLKPPKAENPLDCRVPDSPSMVLRRSGGNPAITPLRAARSARKGGAQRVIAVVIHGLFMKGTAEVAADPAIAQVVITDAVPPSGSTARPETRSLRSCRRRPCSRRLSAACTRSAA